MYVEYEEVWNFINSLKIAKNEEQEKERLFKIFIQNKVIDLYTIRFLNLDLMKEMEIDLGLRMLIMDAIENLPPQNSHPIHFNQQVIIFINILFYF